MSKTSEAQIRANKKWNEKASRFYAVKLRVDSGLPDRLDAAVLRSGKSTNQWLKEAIEQKLDTEAEDRK